MNIDRYKNGLDALIAKGAGLYHAMLYECDSQAYERTLKSSMGDGVKEFIQGLPSFRDEYQS